MRRVEPESGGEVLQPVGIHAGQVARQVRKVEQQLTIRKTRQRQETSSQLGPSGRVRDGDYDLDQAGERANPHLKPVPTKDVDILVSFRYGQPAGPDSPDIELDHPEEVARG